MISSCRPRPHTTGPVIRAVRLENVRLTDDFWRPRLRTNRMVTIPRIMKENEETGRVDNFRKAAGSIPGRYEGRRFNHTDVYKVIEAASYALAQDYDRALDAQLDELIELIAAAQTDDGYIYPARTIDPANPAPGAGPERSIREFGGKPRAVRRRPPHRSGRRALSRHGQEEPSRRRDSFRRPHRPRFRARRASRCFRARRDRARSRQARRCHGREALPDARQVLPRSTRTRARREAVPGRQLRDATTIAPTSKTHVPVVDQRKASGHAVRATYLYIGMADVAARTEAPGGPGRPRSGSGRTWSRRSSTSPEASARGGPSKSFGEDCTSFSNRTAYTETCAAVGNDLWNLRMFLASGQAHFLDVMERVLYNGALSGVSAEGDRFFYQNPLDSAGDVERSSYFDVACCPANLARLLALLPEMIYAERDDEIFVNLFVASEADVVLSSGNRVHIEQETGYPWNGRVRITLHPDAPRRFALYIRIPGWARGSRFRAGCTGLPIGDAGSPHLTVDGEGVDLRPSGRICDRSPRVEGRGRCRPRPPDARTAGASQCGHRRGPGEEGAPERSSRLRGGRRG